MGRHRGECVFANLKGMFQRNLTDICSEHSSGAAGHRLPPREVAEPGVASMLKGGSR